MSTLVVFAVRDEKTGFFMRPFFEKHIASALRSWTEACNQAESPFAKFPADFTLYELGSFDEVQGRLVPLDVPRKVATALEVKQAPAESLPFRAVN